MATTEFDLVTPSATLFSGAAEMIVCKTVEGEIAFLANHEPFIGALDPCVVRVVGPQGSGPPDNSASEFVVAVRGGFVEVKQNHVIMLADMALKPQDIDLHSAETEAAQASDRLEALPPEDEAAKEVAEIELKWARARQEASRL